MNAQLAAKSQPACAVSSRTDRFGTVELRSDAIDRSRLVCQPRRQHQLRAEYKQFVVVAVDAEIELKVERAEGQSHGGRRGGDLHGARDASGGLHNREHRFAGSFRGHPDFIDRFTLRQQHSGDSRVPRQT
jgi:hypothetical protein